jgi:hypothetical protein
VYLSQARPTDYAYEEAPIPVFCSREGLVFAPCAMIHWLAWLQSGVSLSLNGVWIGIGFGFAFARGHARPPEDFSPKPSDWHSQILVACTNERLVVLNQCLKMSTMLQQSHYNPC